jgi:hypothetical protein
MVICIEKRYPLKRVLWLNEWAQPSFALVFMAAAR